MAWDGITVSAVVAMAQNRVIGREGTMPWRVPADLRFFKSVTMGKPIIAGRKTFESFPAALPGRTNIVITRNAAWSAPHARTADSLDAAMALGAEAARADGAQEIVIVGGAEIYAAALGFVDRLYLTEIVGAPDGDTLFPALDPAVWREVRREAFPDDPKASHSAILTVLERIAG